MTTHREWAEQILTIDLEKLNATVAYQFATVHALLSIDEKLADLAAIIDAAKRPA